MWDERYAAAEFVYGTEPNDFLKQEYQQLPTAGSILCLADGEGRNSVFLAMQGFRVTAVDQSAVGLRKATQLAAQNGMEIVTIVADLAEYDLGENCWDGIVSISAHLPSALRQQVHDRAVRALKSGGVFLLEAYTERQLEMPGVGGPSTKDMLMSLHGLKSELSGLEVLMGQEIERNFSEGQYHQGNSAVVQFIAQKP